MGETVIIFGFIALMLGLFALIRGHMKWARITNRRGALVIFAAAAVLVIGGGLLIPKVSTRQSGASQAIFGPSAGPAVAAKTSAMPSTKTIARAAVASPESARQASVTNVAKSRNAAKLLAAAKVRAAAAVASSSSSASKSSAVHEALVAAQQAAVESKAEAASNAARVSASSASVASASSAASAASVQSAVAASSASAASASSSSAAQMSQDFCGAPANPYGYNYCGTGSNVFSPPGDICSFFNCITNFDNGKGYMVECRDGTVSMSGGRRGACSSHGGEQTPVGG